MNPTGKHAAEKLDVVAQSDAAVLLAGTVGDVVHAEGHYHVQCFEVVPEFHDEYHAVLEKFKLTEYGTQEHFDLQAKLESYPLQMVWEAPIENVVCTAGKNLALDTILAGSAYTVVGPYMGLISSVSYTGVAAADTMASHGGWTEAGSTNAPTFAARGTPAWSAASAGSKQTSSAVSFTMTSGGTLKGCFIVYGTGAVTTLMSTAGTLLSAGTFTGGDQVVANGNVVTVTYSLAI